MAETNWYSSMATGVELVLRRSEAASNFDEYVSPSQSVTAVTVSHWLGSRENVLHSSKAEYRQSYGYVSMALSARRSDP